MNGTQDSSYGMGALVNNLLRGERNVLPYELIFMVHGLFYNSLTWKSIFCYLCVTSDLTRTILRGAGVKLSPLFGVFLLGIVHKSLLLGNYCSTYYIVHR